jgi:ABC-type Fe3+-siderophore transport system permease subunit
MFGSFPFVMDFNALAPFLIPIVAILGAFTVGIVSMILKSRQEERAHRERMFLAEKGLEIPKELYQSQSAQMLKQICESGVAGVPVEKKPSDLRWLRTLLIVFGTLMLFIGLGVLIMLTYQSDIREGMNGVVPLMIGLGLLVAAWLVTLTVVRRNGKGQ